MGLFGYLVESDLIDQHLSLQHDEGLVNCSVTSVDQHTEALPAVALRALRCAPFVIDCQWGCQQTARLFGFLNTLISLVFPSKLGQNFSNFFEAPPIPVTTEGFRILGRTCEELMDRDDKLLDDATIIEKRQFPRLDVDLPVVLRHNGHLIPATALNISCGGMRLKTDNPNIIDNGNVEIIFDLATGEKDVSLRGKIIRLKRDEETEMGIQFINLYSTGHQALERFIRKHLH